MVEIVPLLPGLSSLKNAYPSRPVRLAPHALDGNPLRLEHIVRERIHGGGGFVDGFDEGERAFEDGASRERS